MSVERDTVPMPVPVSKALAVEKVLGRPMSNSGFEKAEKGDAMADDTRSNHRIEVGKE